MKLTLFNESIAHFDKYIQEMLMSEHPHGRIQASETIPHGNYIDLGFENYGVPEKTYKALYTAIYNTGCKIPGTNFRIRCGPGDIYLVEPSDGTETATLPKNWRQAMYVMQLGEKDEFVFIGKLVRQHQIGTFRRTTLPRTQDGFGYNHRSDRPRAALPDKSAR
jgi:hypothetical protein